MKLLYIVPRLGGAGGVQRVLLLKAGYLSDNMGYNVTIVVTNPDEHEVLFPVAKGITIKRVVPKKVNALHYLFAYRKAIAKAVHEVQPDIVVICDNGLKSLFLKKLLPAKVPVVYEMHASKYLIGKELKKKRITNLFYKPLLALGSRFFSGYTKFVALTRGGADEWQLNNALVLPNPIWFSVDGHNNLEQKKVVVMSRHVPQKGYDRMFRIWKKVSENYPDWTLEIYGAYNPAYNLKKMAALLMLNNVVFHNPVVDIASAYIHASLSIMTSYSEPFGMVLIEAMECGVPCVAFNCPFGPEAIIKDGENGFLIPDTDENCFDSRLQELMGDASLRIKLGAEAKQTAANFNLVTIMDQWDALFRSLAQRT